MYLFDFAGSKMSNRICIRMLALLLLSFTARSREIDNHVVGEPSVDCQDTSVAITITTKKPFTGRFYVRGLQDDSRCSRNFATNVDQNRASLTVENGDCAMVRQRVTGALEGVMFSLVLVVSFHGTFITKVDRAYRCMCFAPIIKHLTAQMEISEIGTTELLDTMRMPICTYSIRFGSPEGPPARYARIGEKIFHVWECDDETQGFLVRSCWVNDGRGTRFDLLDFDGCAVDPIIQPDVTYDQSLTRAYVETHGYKFSDISVLNYQCTLELCKKTAGECDGFVPPYCGSQQHRGGGGRSNNVNRYPRSVKTIIGEKSLDSESVAMLGSERGFDVAASLNVLDTLEEDLDESGIPDELMNQLNRRYPFHPRSGLLPDPSKMCLSTPMFGLMLGITVIVLLTAVVTGSFLILSRRYEKA